VFNGVAVGAVVFDCRPILVPRLLSFFSSASSSAGLSHLLCWAGPFQFGIVGEEKIRKKAEIEPTRAMQY
jgi:hypothetical protein